jgi:excisionase family DNA binding protein
LAAGHQRKLAGKAAARNHCPSERGALFRTTARHSAQFVLRLFVAPQTYLRESFCSEGVILMLYLTIAQSAARTGAAEATLRKACREGRLSGYKIGPRCWLIPPDALASYERKWRANVKRKGRVPPRKY